MTLTAEDRADEQADDEQEVDEQRVRIKMQRENSLAFKVFQQTASLDNWSRWL
jgi:hypothetical protein